jgi:hypothetical protein
MVGCQRVGPTGSAPRSCFSPMTALDHNPVPQPSSGNGASRKGGGDLQHEARKALELRAGRRFGDREWEQMRRKLTEVYAILRAWEKEPKPEPHREKRKLKAG